MYDSYFVYAAIGATVCGAVTGVAIGGIIFVLTEWLLS